METGSRNGLDLQRNNSDEPISAAASATASAADPEMLDHQHTQAEQELIEVEKLNDEAKF